MANKVLTSAVAATLGSAPLLVHASDWYVTLGGGQVSHQLDTGYVDKDWQNALGAAGATFNNTGSGVSSTLSNNSSTAWRVGVGYQFLPVLSGEVEYLYLGKPRATLAGTVDGPEGAAGTSSLREDAFGVSAVVQLPGMFSPYLRVGALRWSSSNTISGTIGSPTVLTTGTIKYSDNGVSAYGGIGVQYNIPAAGVGVRAEWDRLSVAGAAPNLLTLSVVYKFR